MGSLCPWLLPELKLQPSPLETVLCPASLTAGLLLCTVGRHSRTHINSHTGDHTAAQSVTFFQEQESAKEGSTPVPASSLPRKHPYTHVTHHACSPAWQAARPPGFSDARPPARASLAGGELQGPVHRSAERVPDLGPASPCSAPRSMLRVCLCLLLPASPVLPAPHPGMPAALQPGTASRLLAPNQAPFIGPSPAFTIENRTPAPSHSGNWNAGDAGMASPALTGRGGVSVCPAEHGVSPTLHGSNLRLPQSKQAASQGLSILIRTIEMIQ